MLSSLYLAFLSVCTGGRSDRWGEGDTPVTEAALLLRRMLVISSSSLMNFTMSLWQQLESLPTLTVI